MATAMAMAIAIVIAIKMAIAIAMAIYVYEAAQYAPSVYNYFGALYGEMDIEVHILVARACSLRWWSISMTLVVMHLSYSGHHTVRIRPGGHHQDAEAPVGTACRGGPVRFLAATAADTPNRTVVLTATRSAWVESEDPLDL